MYTIICYLNYRKDLNVEVLKTYSSFFKALSVAKEYAKLKYEDVVDYVTVKELTIKGCVGEFTTGNGYKKTVYAVIEIPNEFNEMEYDSNDDFCRCEDVYSDENGILYLNHLENCKETFKDKYKLSPLNVDGLVKDKKIGKNSLFINTDFQSVKTERDSGPNSDTEISSNADTEISSNAETEISSNDETEISSKDEKNDESYILSSSIDSENESDDKLEDVYYESYVYDEISNEDDMDETMIDSGIGEEEMIDSAIVIDDMDRRPSSMLFNINNGNRYVMNESESEYESVCESEYESESEYEIENESEYEIENESEYEIENESEYESDMDMDVERDYYVDNDWCGDGYEGECYDLF
jgi:hypothetical protein